MTYFAWENLADLGIIGASSAKPTLPASHLQSVHVAELWRSNSSSAWLMADLGTSKAVDLALLRGVNLTMASEVRVRIGDDPAFATWAYDSGTLSGQCDPKFGSLVHILAAAVTGRYVRIDFNDPALGYIQAGRMVVAEGWRPQINMSWGAGRGYETLSRPSQSRSGQIYIDVGAKQRRWSMSFDTLRPEELDVVELIDIRNGTDIDVFVCADEDSINLGRDSIWGLVKSPTDINRVAIDRNSKSYTIMERL